MTKRARPKQASPGKEIEVRKSTDLAPPNYIDQSNEGLEDLRPQDLVLPRLVLMQALTPAVMNKERESGEVINSLTGEKWLGVDESLEFVPVLHYLEWIEWGDRDAQEGIIERSVDPSSSLALRAQNGEMKETKQGRTVRAVTEYHNFVCVFPERGENQMVVLSCAKTNYKKGRKLIALARYRGNFPLYAGKYRLSTAIEKNRAGQQYFVFEVENAGWCPKDLYDECKGLYAGLKKARSFSVDRDHEQHDESGPTEIVDTEI